MTYTIYQLPREHDNIFLSYELSQKRGGVNIKDYEAIYSGEVEGTDPVTILESLYTKFNLDHPADYTGRSMSVSDVVKLESYGTYFCDSFGFKKI